MVRGFALGGGCGEGCGEGGEEQRMDKYVGVRQMGELWAEAIWQWQQLMTKRLMHTWSYAHLVLCALGLATVLTHLECREK